MHASSKGTPERDRGREATDNGEFKEKAEGIVGGGAIVIRDAAIAASADSLAVHTFRVSSP